MTETVREALAWYGEQARLARLIHSEGDTGRHALADDGGKRAKAALALAPAPTVVPDALREANLGAARAAAKKCVYLLRQFVRLAQVKEPQKRRIEEIAATAEARFAALSTQEATDRVEALRGLSDRATAGEWEVQDGCSWRRIGTREGDGNVLCPTNHHIDGHPDLHAGRGEDTQANLDLIVAAVNYVRAQLATPQPDERSAS